MNIKEIRYSENRNIGGNMRYGWKQFGATAEVGMLESPEYASQKLQEFVQSQISEENAPPVKRVTYEEYEKARLLINRYREENR